MFVYAVIDNPPAEFSEVRILEIFLLKESAETYKDFLKGNKPYENQYIEVKRFKLRK